VRDEGAWKPTKFEQRGGVWRGNRDIEQLARGSRVMADLQACAYASALAGVAHGELLDLGAGSVPLYGMYRPYVSGVTCVDWANTAHPSPHLDLDVDLREPLPFGDASFDTVVATDVLEHMPYPERLFAEIVRLLRPGGVIVVGVPFSYPLHEEPFDYFRYTEHRLRLFCADAGVTCEQVFAYGGPSAVMLDHAAKALDTVRPLRVLAGLPALAARPRRADARPTPLPLGYVMVVRN